MKTAFLLSSLAAVFAAVIGTDVFASTGNDQQQASKLPFPENHQTVLAQAAALGAPMQAVARAMKEAERGTFTKKDVISVFDISQPAKNKRYYVLDFRAGKTSAYHSSHGYGNGGHEKAVNFKGFQREGADMVPLGALKTKTAYVLEEYETVEDRYNGKTYHGLVVVDIEGTRPYNSRFNREDLWAILHSKWYVTEGYRNANNGNLGRSKGCIVLDPVYSNQVFKRTSGGSLIYVTVGNDPIEKYL